MPTPPPVTIVVEADQDGDALPDSWEMAGFATLNFSPTDAPDGDGQNNAFELITDPNDSTSRLQIDLAGNDPKSGTVRLSQVQPGVLYTLETSEDMLHWDAVATQEFPIEGQASSLIQAPTTWRNGFIGSGWRRFRERALLFGMIGKRSHSSKPSKFLMANRPSFP